MHGPTSITPCMAQSTTSVTRCGQRLTQIWTSNPVQDRLWRKQTTIHLGVVVCFKSPHRRVNWVKPSPRMTKCTQPTRPRALKQQRGAPGTCNQFDGGFANALNVQLLGGRHTPNSNGGLLRTVAKQVDLLLVVAMETAARSRLRRRAEKGVFGRVPTETVAAI
jgi:hypothetical protein